MRDPQRVPPPRALATAGIATPPPTRYPHRVRGDSPRARPAWVLALVIAICCPAAATAEDLAGAARSGEALRQQSVRALLAAPEDAELARGCRGGCRRPSRNACWRRWRNGRRVPEPARLATPPHMAHGQLLLALGRPADAATSFEKAAACAPRARGLAGPGARAGRRPAAGGGAGGVRAGRRGAGRIRSADLQEAAVLAATVSPAREVAMRRRLVEATPSARAALALARAMARRGRRGRGGAAARRLGGRARARAAKAATTLSHAERLALLQEAARLHEAAGQDDAAEAALLTCPGSGGFRREPAALELTRQLAALALRTGRGEAPPACWARGCSGPRRPPGAPGVRRWPSCWRRWGNWNRRWRPGGSSANRRGPRRRC